MLVWPGRISQKPEIHDRFLAEESKAGTTRHAILRWPWEPDHVDSPEFDHLVHGYPWMSGLQPVKSPNAEIFTRYYTVSYTCQLSDIFSGSITPSEGTRFGVRAKVSSKLLHFEDKNVTVLSSVLVGSWIRSGLVFTVHLAHDMAASPCHHTSSWSGC